jgi:hypothetical protein
MGVTPWRSWRSLRHDAYSQVMAGSRRRAAGRVAGVLFSNVLEFEENAQSGKTN